MNYLIDNKYYDVEIIKKSNKNTYLRVKDSKIIITTNYFTSSSYIMKLLDNNQDTIKKMLKKQQQSDLKKDKFYYLGNTYDIIIMPTIDKMNIIDNQIIVKNERELIKFILDNTKKVFLERLNTNYHLFDESIPYPNLKIRKMKTRWGVCSKKKIITLNSELIKYSVQTIDYVIIHELSHFIHFNHSKKFWALVSKYCPNYKLIRKSLKG